MVEIHGHPRCPRHPHPRASLRGRVSCRVCPSVREGGERILCRDPVLQTLRPCIRGDRNAQ